MTEQTGAAAMWEAEEALRLVQRWEQTLLIRGEPELAPADPGFDFFSPCGDPAGDAQIDLCELRFTLQDAGGLRKKIHKGGEGVLSLLLPDGDAEGGVSEFVVAGRSHEGGTRWLAEWIYEATVDLRYRVPLRLLSPLARTCIEAQAQALDGCLAGGGWPVDVVLRDSTRKSWVGSPPSPRAAVGLPCRDLASFAARLRSARHVIVMLGAGASVSAGIPDFRSPGTGLYSQLAEYELPRPEAIFDINFFRANPRPFYRLAAELWPGNYAPTAAHHFVALLHRAGRLQRVYTQNIDSLEAAAGLPKELIVAAHGNFDGARVIDGGPRVPPDELRAALLAGRGAVDALNAKHGGLVKPDITFFGERLPPRFGKLAPDDFAACDLLIVMGTSLKVQPFASLTDFPDRGTPRLLINRERVGDFDFEPGAREGAAFPNDVFYQGDCDEGARALAALAGCGPQLELAVRGELGPAG